MASGKSRTLPNSTQFPPKAKRLTLVGSIPYLLNNKMDFLFDEQARLGDIYTVDAGIIDMIMLCHPRHAQHVLRDHARKYDKGGTLYDALRILAGNGLVTNNDTELWLRQRRMVQPHFHRERLQEMATTMVQAMDEIILELDSVASPNQAIDFTEYVYRLTMNIIIQTMFGTYLSADEAVEAGRAAFDAFNFILPATLTGNLPTWLPIPGKRNYNKNIQILDSLVYKVLDRCRKQHEPPSGLMGMLINMTDAETNEQMTDKQLRDEAITVFLAGYETTSVALGWATHYLNLNPEVKRRAYAEVDSALEGNAPTFSDLRNLNYLYRIMQETLRLRAPGFLISRHSVVDDSIDGYHIDANKMVFINVHLIHHHPDIWENPTQFDPDRFLQENTTKRDQYSWIPFGSGQRQCIGRDFSLMEGQLILARLLQRYTIEPSNPYEVQPHYTAFTQSPNSVPVTLTPR